MAETPRIPAPQLDAQRAAEALHSAQKATPRAGPQSASPAFEALLERLTTSAADLEEKTKALASPAELPGAVDAARASLEDAVSLAESLLEAYRASLSRPSQADGGASGASPARPGADGAKDVGP